MSQRVLSRLGRLNPTVVFLGVGAYVFVALVLPGIIGAALLVLLAAGVGWLLTRTWSVQPPAIRIARLVILTLVVALAVVKAT
ncbi:hypothetical protein GCM10010399_05720 [Dactylosporangium fulvum]|uniref:Uncharacterized protein n=2 Tax=Dactylosporangium fulvum TaxID=53359 RepID=A0ABY5VX88_9ACTN|nr:DUF6703 family protein [Dactylosporangium fulvum]UWP81419.1 hypothetical protein Dfulv_40905 [Dactylosporangium fulvum]